MVNGPFSKWEMQIAGKTRILKYIVNLKCIFYLLFFLIWKRFLFLFLTKET